MILDIFKSVLTNLDINCPLKCATFPFKPTPKTQSIQPIRRRIRFAYERDAEAANKAGKPPLPPPVHVVHVVGINSAAPDLSSPLSHVTILTAFKSLLILESEAEYPMVQSLDRNGPGV